MKRFFFSLVFAFATVCGKPSYAQKQDLTITLQESVLNKMFTALGPIRGTNSYSFMFVEGTYDWVLKNPRIMLHLNRADFVTDVTVTAGKYSYTMHVTGNVEICYEPTTNLIYIEITEAKFPLNIMFMGKPRHLWDVDLAQYFETPFTFDGPLTMGAEMSFEMPDGSTRVLYAHPLNCGVKIAEKQLTVSAEMEFISRPAQTPVAKPTKK
jgi:hypothetical protein